MSNPQGITFDGEGNLYVSDGDKDRVKKFDASGTHVGNFASGNGLDFPTGVSFGPDGNLYVTSFRFNSPPDSAAIDSIRVYNPGGQLKGKDTIPLDIAGQPRSFAQAILFGPDGKLFVPISGNDPATTGEIRRYDVKTKQYGIPTFVPAGRLTSPQYLTFGRTNPATLAYEGN